MRNIVVLLCDALRYDAVKKDFMPEIYELSKEAFVYTNAHTCETCTVLSMPYFLCGKQKYDLDESIVTYLNNQGYFTSLLTTNFFITEKFHGGWMQKQYHPPIQQNNNLYRIINRLRRKFAIICMQNLPVWIESIHRAYKKLPIPYTPSNRLLPIAENIICHQPQPWFMWIHLMDTHGPYYPLSKNYSKVQIARMNILLERYRFYMRRGAIYSKIKFIKTSVGKLRKLYLDSAMELDHELSKFIRKRKSDIVILTSDHGELFGENDFFMHLNGNQHIKAATHVPLIVWGLGRGRSNRLFKMDNFPKLIHTCLGFT